MKIATWNINGVRARVETLKTWLEEASPDVVCLQETKCADDAFPREALDGTGYNLVLHGEKGFNGVAILSKRPPEDVEQRLPGDGDDAQARYVEASVPYGAGTVRIASLYLPNGNPITSPKFAYKLAWMERLVDHARGRLAHEEPLVLAGDFNVIPEARDARNPAAWADDALFQPESRAGLRKLLNIGFADGLRTCRPEDGLYTFWDYQGAAWQRNNGIRIDHLLLSPQATDRLAGAGVDRHVRGRDKPSDHVPVWIELEA